MKISPINFLDTYDSDGHIVKYSNFKEISQGGPEVGKLTIDGKTIGSNGDYFGGPPFFYEGKMFLPQLKNSLLGSRFHVCIVDLESCRAHTIGEAEELILIFNVDDTSVYFYADEPNKTTRTVPWK